MGSPWVALQGGTPSLWGHGSCQHPTGDSPVSPHPPCWSQGGGGHVPAPSPLQPMQVPLLQSQAGGLAGGRQPAGGGTVTVTFGAASQPGLLHGDIVPTPSVPRRQLVSAPWWPSRWRCSPRLSQAVVPRWCRAAAGTSTRWGTSDSALPHDRVLGCLTQPCQWQRGGPVPTVALARWQGCGALAWPWRWPGLRQRLCRVAHHAEPVTCGTRRHGALWHVPGATVPCHAMGCHICATCHTVMCHLPRCATAGQAPSHPVLPCHAMPAGTTRPPAHGPSPPTATRTQGHGDSTAHWPTGRGRRFISFCPCTKIGGVPGGHRPAHSTKKYRYS